MKSSDVIHDPEKETSHENTDNKADHEHEEVNNNPENTQQTESLEEFPSVVHEMKNKGKVESHDTEAEVEEDCTSKKKPKPWEIMEHTKRVKKKRRKIIK